MKPIFITAFFLLISYFSIGQNPIFSADAYRNDTVCQYPLDCDITLYTLKTSAFSFCKKAKGVRYTYEIDFDNDGTIDLTGNKNSVTLNKNSGLNFGTHKIIWTAKDICGYTSKVSKLFTILDCKKPTPIINNSLVPDSNCHIKINAVQLNALSYDNCTAMNNLRFKVAKQGEYSSIMTFDQVLALNDSIEFDLTLSKQLVALFVIDEKNNWDYAETYISNSNCKLNYDTLNKFIVAKNEFGQIIKNYNLDVNGTNISIDNGVFNLPKLTNTTKITPSKLDNRTNGVNALDIAIIQDYIFSIKGFENQNRKFAADVSGDYKIATNDIVTIKKSILNPTLDLFDSWRLYFRPLVISKDLILFNLINTTNPDIEKIDSLNKSTLTLSYYQNSIIPDTIVYLGIKMGDVDLSSNPDSLLTIEERATEKSVIKLENVEFQSNELKTISLPFNSLASAKAYQGTLHFDTQKFEFVEVVGLDQEQYSLGDIENGNITFLHAANLYKPLDNIQLMLKAKQNCYLAEGLSFSSNPLVSEVYWTDKQWSKLEMQFENKTALLLQNTPNPFSNSTSIPFVLPSQQEVRFDFYDVNGSLIKSMIQDYSAGYHQLTINENELNATGIIYYQMITKDNIQTKNMLLIKK